MLISVEGADGTGKSTTAKMLAEYFESQGRSVFLTKEPGSPHDPICGKIRKILLDPENEVAERAAFFLFLADRAQHMEKVRLALEAGQVVISDRSSLSTYVYHAAALSDWYLLVEGLNVAIDYAQQIPPDLCFICSADLEWSMERLKERQQLDRIEQFDIEFHKRVHEFFKPEPIKEITCELICAPKSIYYPPLASEHSPEQIHEWIMEKVNGL